MNEDAALALREFVGSARWFGGKGRDVTVADVRRAGVLEGAAGPPSAGADETDEEPPRVGVELVTLQYADAERETYQVPLAYYRRQQERLDHALVGSWDDDELGTVHAYDAVHDRRAAALWLEAFGSAAGGEVRVGELAFHRLPGHDLDLDSPSTVFSGEQSNSSVAFGSDSLMKLFRKVTPGDNPDIVIHRALTERGSEQVAPLYGWLELGVDGEPVQLAMLQRFLRTASDGWDLALASVRDLFAEADLHADEVGGDFAGEAERLGLATAQVHDVLAEAFPTQGWDGADLAALSAAMLDRLDAALLVVPELAVHADGLREAFEGVETLGSDGAAATAQRVHGDFHLGQTLRTSRGWKLVDFEGEPAKPLAERVRPDLVWRDVAGMLRSFDYAAHAVLDDFAADEDTNRQLAFRATEWADRNQGAFLRGYTDSSVRTTDADPSARAGLSPDQELVLRAYVADKAVYEAVYEARNRPTWLPIPLAAIARATRTTSSAPTPTPSPPPTHLEAH